MSIGALLGALYMTSPEVIITFPSEIITSPYTLRTTHLHSLISRDLLRKKLNICSFD